MGTVYEAHHRHLDRRVAIKFLCLTGAASPDAGSRFEKESRSIAQIDHPHVLRALDAGQWQGHPYVVTEKLDGLDLQQWVDQHGPVSQECAVEWIRQAASGLQAAHELGLVHRDVKPSNLFVCGNSSIKVIDFGLVRQSNSDTASTQSGQFLGTVDYLSPEQATAPERATAACDIYSLGCVWIYLLSGSAPFPDARYPGFLAKLKGHMTETPPWLASAEAKRMHPSIRHLLKQMLAKEPDHRPKTAAEVVLSLEKFKTQVRDKPGVKKFLPLWLFTTSVILGILGYVFKAELLLRGSENRREGLSAEASVVAAGPSDLMTEQDRPSASVQTVRSQVRSAKPKPKSSKSGWLGFPLDLSPEATR